MTYQEFIERIKAKEDDKHKPGSRFYPYKDPSGNLTIGWGRNLSSVGISEEEAEMLLENDIAYVMREVNRRLPWVLEAPENCRYALYEMAYNMGIGGLMKWRDTLNDIKNGQYENAAQRIMKSLWRQQVGKRAEEVARLIKDAKGETT